MAASGSVRSGPADRRRAALAGRRARYKRPFDLAVLAFGLVVLLPVWPVLIGAIALAVRLSGPGPVLYRQARLGRGGREFRIGVEPTFVSSAAKFGMQGPCERSCRGQNGRRGSRGARSTASRPRSRGASWPAPQRGRAKSFCEDGNVAMLDSVRLMAGLVLSENTCFPTGRQGLLELPI